MISKKEKYFCTTKISRFHLDILKIKEVEILNMPFKPYFHKNKRQGRPKKYEEKNKRTRSLRYGEETKERLLYWGENESEAVRKLTKKAEYEFIKKFCELGIKQHNYSKKGLEAWTKSHIYLRKATLSLSAVFLTIIFLILNANYYLLKSTNLIRSLILIIVIIELAIPTFFFKKYKEWKRKKLSYNSLWEETCKERVKNRYDSQLGPLKLPKQLEGLELSLRAMRICFGEKENL